MGRKQFKFWENNMANIVYIAASIDGYIARENGNLDWLINLPNPDNSDYGFSDLMERIDGIIMGRKTFEAVSGFEKWLYPKPVFVLSNTLSKLPDAISGKAEIIRGKLKTILSGLNGRGINNIYIDGGITIQSFLKEDLIDEMIITRIPILLGSGIPLFTPGNRELKFDHFETVIYDNMLVKSRYIRNRN